MSKLRSFARHGKLDTLNRKLSKEEKLILAAPRGVEFVSRVSSEGQRENEGSFLNQEVRQSRIFERHNIDTTNATITRLVESGSGDADRRQFRALIERMESGRLGVVTVAYGSRLARNMADAARLVSVGAQERIIFVIRDQILDPRVPRDKNEIQRQVLDAELENETRTLYSTESREELARQQKYRRRLPVGLVWAPANDILYDLLASANENLPVEDPDELSRQQTQVTMEGVRLYVRFDPHPDVYTSLSLILKWLFETRDPSEVVRRIRKHSAYPRPGLVPAVHHSVFNVARSPTWVTPSARWLRYWLMSEAVYGCYSYRSVALSKYGDDECPHIFYERSFKSYLELEDRAVVEEIFANPKRMWKRGSYSGPRTALLHRVRCGELRPDGTRCGRTMGAVYEANGRAEYVSGVCKFNDRHLGKVTTALDDAVLGLLGTVFSSANPARVLEAMEHDRAQLKAELRRAELRQAELNTLVDGGMQKEAEARAQRKAREELNWSTKRMQWEHEATGIERSVDRLRRELASSTTNDEHRLSKASRLLDDLGGFLRHCRDADSVDPTRMLCQSLIARLVSRVFVRSLGAGLTQVDVEFPSGAEVRGYLSTGLIRPSYAERTYIASELARGEAPAYLATRLSELRAVAHSIRIRYGRPAIWTPTAVLAVDLVSDSTTWKQRNGVLLSATAIAKEYGISKEEVLAAIFADRLGPIEWRDGEPWAAPSASELERCFPAHVRQIVAAYRHWCVADIIPVAELLRDFRLSHRRAVAIAEKHGVVHRASSRGRRLYVNRALFAEIPEVQSVRH